LFRVDVSDPTEDTLKVIGSIGTRKASPGPAAPKPDADDDIPPFDLPSAPGARETTHVPASQHVPARGSISERARAQAMLEAVGLQALGERLPEQLSGGQMQRVAIARALVHQPPLLLADEPTGNLDPAHAAEVLELLLTQSTRQGASLVLVTHNLQAAQQTHHVLELTPTGLRPWCAAS
ncbi:MAG: ATP-binding cassette domain-containing protein, partial [Burkholderiaceae bacterium]